VTGASHGADPAPRRCPGDPGDARDTAGRAATADRAIIIDTVAPTMSIKAPTWNT
jgi:hypothetical protein